MTDFCDPGWDLPLAHERRAVHAVPVTYTPIGDLGTLRQRLLDAAKGRRGDAWAAIRKIAAGERMLTLHDTIDKDPTAPIVYGVDEFVSKQIVWQLATHPDFMEVPPAEIAQAFAPSLAILRADAAAVNRPDPGLWTCEHLSEKFARATEKARANASDDDAFLAKIGSLGSPGPIGSNGVELPLIVQLAGNSFRVLCADQTYQAADAGSLWITCRDAWNASHGEDVADRMLNQTNSSGARKRMKADDLAATYGLRGNEYVLDHRILVPKFERGELVAPPKRGTLPEPVEHAEVDEWLRTLFGPHAETALDWLACSGVAKLDGFLPALALVGPPGCGKSLLGSAVARTHGTPAQPLEALLGTFHDGADLSSCFIADERTLRDDRGIPRTQEIRSVITSAERRINPKGQTPFKVRGAVRLVFTANSFEAVFPMVGTLGDDDVRAIAERFLYVEVTRERGAIAKGLIDAIGGGEMGARIDAVAQHIRRLQETRAVASGGRFMVRTNGAELHRKLARSSNGLAEVLEQLERGQIHERDSVWYVSPERLAQAIGGARLSAQKIGTVVREHLALRDERGDIVAPHLRNAWGAPRAKAVALDKARLSALVDTETMEAINEAASVVVPVARVN